MKVSSRFSKIYLVKIIGYLLVIILFGFLIISKHQRDQKQLREIRDNMTVSKQSVQTEDNISRNFDVDKVSIDKPIYNLSVDGVIEYSQLPKLPIGIDPDDIPPFYMLHEDGKKSHYNRPLTSEELDMYYRIQKDPLYDDVDPAGLKMSAVILVRIQRKEAVEIDYIFQDLGSGKITSNQARILLDQFHEVTR